MSPPWGINWQRYHPDNEADMTHIERMGYRSFTLYGHMWTDQDFCQTLLAHALPDAIFLIRDHPLSEQKDDEWKNDPAGKGRKHADEWAKKVREGRVHMPLDRSYFLGLNEPNSNKYQRQIDAYNEALCRRMTEHGLRAAAYSWGVGHPSSVNLQPDTPPDWSHYEASAAAVLEGDHIVAMHEYGAPDGYGWGYWCNRSRHCPHPFKVVLDECGIDNGVVSGVLKGWKEFMSPEEYLVWLDGFQLGMAERRVTRDVEILAYNIFSYDHGRGSRKDWWSWDIRPLRGMIEDYPWSVPKPAGSQPPELDDSKNGEHSIFLPSTPKGTQSQPTSEPTQPQPKQPTQHDAARDAYGEWFREYGKTYNVPWYLLAALAYHESAYDPSAVSSAGAQGLMQFMPATWGDMQTQIGVSDPFEPEQSIKASAYYLNQIRRYLQGFGRAEWRYILAGYNWGPYNAATKPWEAAPAATRRYARDVLVLSEALRRWETTWQA